MPWPLLVSWAVHLSCQRCGVDKIGGGHLTAVRVIRNRGGDCEQSKLCSQFHICALGVIPGSNFKIPFKCPMDHVFDLEGGWARDLPADVHGPNTDFK